MSATDELKPWFARGWVGVSVERLVFEKRCTEAWQAQDALTVIAQSGTRFDRVAIDYEPTTAALSQQEGEG